MLVLVLVKPANDAVEKDLELEVKWVKSLLLLITRVPKCAHCPPISLKLLSLEAHLFCSAENRPVVCNMS